MRHDFWGWRSRAERAAENRPTPHKLLNDEFCSCGQDAVTCQHCGQRVCGNVAVRVSDENRCPGCASFPPRR
jgi:hypothetical protein